MVNINSYLLDKSVKPIISLNLIKCLLYGWRQVTRFQLANQKPIDGPTENRQAQTHTFQFAVAGLVVQITDDFPTAPYFRIPW